MRALLLLAALAAALAAACGDGRAKTATPASGGTAGSTARSGFVCGTAAGVCTCVDASDADPETLAEAAPTSCEASDCCFEARDGRCSCRFPDAPLACTDLMQALGVIKSVPHCP